MQIPIINGIYTDQAGDFRSSYPRNLIPVPKSQGISEGYLRPAEGIAEFGTGPGIDRGGINWNGVCYRVMGTKLVSVSRSGVITEIGDVGGDGQVSLDYSFDYLAIASNGNLFLYDGFSLRQVTDENLGNAKDVIWIDGYFMTCDDESLVVSELNDPFEINPLKYGSSEIDPDDIQGLLKIRNEAYAVNRYTIEVFDNVGGSLFPFQRIDGGQIDRGAVGTHAFAYFDGNIAFVGSRLNESPSVWIGSNGATAKIATREIDTILQGYSDSVLSNLVVNVKTDRGHDTMMIHLPDQTLCYDLAASKVMQTPIWYVLDSMGVYKGRNPVWCYGKWIVGDPTAYKLGVLDFDVSSHYGNVITWDFSTSIIYNGGRGAIFHELELVCLSGRVSVGESPMIYTQYSLDGESYSQIKTTRAGRNGKHNARIVWLQQGTMKNWRLQKFAGDSRSHLTIARLEAVIEGLAF